MSKPRKECSACGSFFYKKGKDSKKQWENRRFCSISCRNKSPEYKPPHIRFWSFVNKNRSDECWEWMGSTDRHGYGRLSTFRGSSPIKAHRLSWEIHNGELSKELVVLHLCDNPNCVNPNHLKAGTQKDNMRDASKKGRLNPKSLENLVPGGKGFNGAALKHNEVSNG